LLEYAEEVLFCNHVIVYFKKNRADQRESALLPTSWHIFFSSDIPLLLLSIVIDQDMTCGANCCGHGVYDCLLHGILALFPTKGNYVLLCSAKVHRLVELS